MSSSRMAQAGKRSAKPAAKSRPKSGSNLIPGKGRGPAKGAPNAGRPPSVVRDICRAAFAERIPALAKLADEAESQSDRLRALDLLAKYGGMSSIEVSEAPKQVAVDL